MQYKLANHNRGIDKLAGETIAIVNELLVYDYLKNKGMNLNEMSTRIKLISMQKSFLSKIFDTSKALRLQKYLIDKVRSEKNIIENLENDKSFRDIKDEYIFSFLKSYNYLNLFYPTFYILGTFIALQIVNKIKEDKDFALKYVDILKIKDLNNQKFFKELKINEEELLEIIDIEILYHFFDF